MLLFQYNIETSFKMKRNLFLFLASVALISQNTGAEDNTTTPSDTSLIEKTDDGLETAGTATLGTAGNVLKAVGTATLGTAGNVLETVGTATVDTAGTVLATVGKEVGETLGAVRTGVVDLGQDALKIITKPGETLKSGLNTVGGLGDTLIGALTDDGKTAVNIVQNPLQAAKKAASTVANVSKKVGTAVAKGATALVNNPVTAVTNTAKATGKIVHDLKTNLVDNSLKDVDKAVLGMVEGAAANPLTTAALVAGGALVGKALAGETVAGDVLVPPGSKRMLALDEFAQGKGEFFSYKPYTTNSYYVNTSDLILDTSDLM